jgi:hypothetical protein
MPSERDSPEHHPLTPHGQNGGHDNDGCSDAANPGKYSPSVQKSDRWPGEKHKRRQGRVGEPSGVGSISAIENSAAATKTRVQDQSTKAVIQKLRAFRRARAMSRAPPSFSSGPSTPSSACPSTSAPISTSTRRLAATRPPRQHRQPWLGHPSPLRGYALSRLALRGQLAHPLSLGRHQPRASARRERHDHPGRPGHPVQPDLLLRDRQRMSTSALTATT